MTLGSNSGSHPFLRLTFARFLLASVFVLLSDSASGQRFNLTTLNIENGLPSENVYDVLQDEEGFLWFATLSGLARYDGYDFRVYNDADGLTDSKIKQLLLFKGKMLVLSWGYQLYEYENDKFKPYELDSTIHESRLTLFPDGETLWIGTREGIYGVTDKQIRVVTADDIKIDALVPKAIYREGQFLWIVNQWRGCSRYNLETGEARHFTSEKDGLVNDLNYCITSGLDGDMIVGGYGGISVIRGDSVTPYLLSGEPNANRVMSIAKDADNGFWLGLYGRGVMLWKDDTEVFSLEGTPNIPDRYTYSVTVDFENNKWVVTEGGGVYMFNDLSMAVYTRDHGLSSEKINTLHIADNGEILLGNADGMMDVYKNGSFSSTPITDEGGNPFFVFDIETDTTGTWVSGNLGVFHITSSGNDLTNSMQRGFEIANTCYKTSDGITYFGSLFGIFTIQDDTVKYIPSIDNKGAVFVSDVRAMAEDKRGTLWIGGLGNLFYLKEDKVKQFSLGDFRKRGLLCAAVAPDGNVWFGGENLLMEIRYQNKDTVVEEYDVRNLLNAASISAIVFKDGFVWVAYERGVLKISVDELKTRKLSGLKRYSFESGFPASETSLGAMAVDSNGVIWAATYKGLVRIDPSKHQKNLNVPKLRLNNIELFSESIMSDLPSEFDYDENYLTIHFKAFNYTQSGDVLYSYRLKGLSRFWSPPGNQRYASYAYLPPGKYEFMVKAKYEDGSWSEPQVMYVFKIHAPFWKTWWFYTLIVVVILGIAGVIVYSRIRKVRRDAERSKAFSAGLLKVQEEERVRIARDLHDTVGQNLLFVRNKVRELPKGEGLSTQIDSTITEIRQIISAIHPMQIRNFGLSFALESLKLKLEEISDIFVTSEIDKEIDGLFDDQTALHIFRVAQEALNNIVKHAGASAANIMAEKTGEKFVLKIRDNGKGFDFEKSRDLSVKSFGLTSMTERSEMIGGKLRVYNGKPKGSIVELSIRLNESSNRR